MDRRTLIAAAFLASAASACQEQQKIRLDGSNEAAFNESRTLARRQLPDADRLIFDRAIRTVGGRRMAERDAQALARVTFDGMTAEEVVADQRARD